MQNLKSLLVVLVVILAVSAAPAWLQAQTAASGYVSGTVSDPTGAVVPGAEVKLEDPATGTAYTTTTNAAGRYVFPSVAPAAYKLTASMQGFRTATVADLKVDIAKSYTQNFTLEVGAVEQVVEVTAGAGVELQTTDAAVGSTVGGETLLRMPSASRSVAGLLLLQPNTIPGRGETNLTGGQVAGARSDQNTYLIDGGEATSNVEGTGGYNTGQAGEPVPMIPVPVDSIEEFRVSTTNQNATFGRSQGGQIVLTTKRGTNTVHGSAYWYHQNDNLNANTWTRNRTDVDKPELKDNRYGFSLGGPLRQDSTWLFGHFEGRRFPRSSEITRLVPTAAMRAGILTFTDAAGNDVQYDLNGTGCAGGACDPRALGLSPVVSDVYNILPVGNDTALGDGLNTIGFRATVDSTLETNFFVARLDQKITDRWNFFASYRYFNQLEPNVGQIDISNLLGNGVSSAASNPLEPRYIVGGFSGQITPNLTSETRISWYRHWWLWDRTDPFPPVASSGIALALAREGAGGLVSEPINFDAQRARDRLWNGKDTFVSENLSWVKGTHTIQFGGSFRDQHIIHTRSDKVTGGLTGGPTAFLEDGGAFSMSSSFRPIPCSSTVTTNCLQSGDRNTWDDLYALTLGIVDNATRVIVNDSNFIPQPTIFGNTVDVTIQATEVYAQDIWRVTPGLTVTFGLTYQVQVPPEEATGRQSFPVFADTLSPVTMQAYMAARASAALQGQIFDPDIAYLPMTEVAGRTRPTEVDYNNFGPRIAAAWNPSFSNWFFGDRKTVIRGGWSETFARMNGVGLVMTPALGPGVSTLVSCTGPDTTGTCTGGGTTASTAFRLGPDGNNISLPAAPSGFPLVPPRPWGETRAFMIDPGMTLGRSHSLDLTWQRELPGNLILEFGYVGRLGRNLQQAVDVNAVPFFLTDPASGQTIAQAFQAVAEALRAGTTVTAQPFFENMLDPVAIDGLLYGSGATTCAGLPSGSCTGGLVDLEGGDIEDGFFGDTFLVSDLFFWTLSPSGTFSNNQSLINNWVTDGGRSNYHSGFVSLRRRMSQGLTFDVNYTLGRSLDQVGLSQQWISGVNDPWDFDKDYTDSIWDRTHVLNTMWYYELPFGRGRRFASESAVADKIVGGWYMSGIYTAASGLPLCVFAGDGSSIISSLCAIPSGPVNTGGNTEHFGVTGSNGVGTSGTTELNLFGDPEAVLDSFRRPSVATEGRFAESPLRGLPRWNVDIQLGKKTAVTENVNLLFSFDLLNVFNRVEFSDPSTSFFSRSRFGVLSGQFNTPRVIQFGFRIEF